MSQSFELRIIEDGTHSSDHSCLMNLRREIGRTLKELNQKKDKK